MGEAPQSGAQSAADSPGPAIRVDSETVGKLKRVRTYLSEKGLFAVYLKRHDNFAWVTCGHLNHVGLGTEIGGAGVLITPNAHYVVSNNIEAPRLLEEERLGELGYEALVFPWDHDRESALVAEAGLSAGPGGGLPPDRRLIASDVVLSGLGKPVTSLDSDFRRLRYSLTPAEIARYRVLGVLAAEALEGVASSVRPGTTEAEVAGRLLEALWAHRIDSPGVFVGADDRISAFRHPIPTETPIKRRAMLTANARKWGLVVSLTRFVAFGSPDAHVGRRYRAAVDIDCEMMAATTPGRPVAEILHRGLEAYTRLGFPEEPHLHHQGGAIGYLPREYRATPDSDEVVVENQAFAWNPSITGAKSEDTILIAADGPEVLTAPAIYPTLSMEKGGIRFTRPDMLLL